MTLNKTHGENYVELKNILHKNIVTVTFEKLDGSERVMTCTLQEDFIPQDMKPKGTVARTVNYDVISAYDIKSQGWRSFRLDKVKNIQIGG